MRDLRLILTLIIAFALHTTSLMAQQWNVLTTTGTGGKDAAASADGNFFVADETTVYENTVDGTEVGSTSYPVIDCISYHGGVLVYTDDEHEEAIHNAAGIMYAVSDASGTVDFVVRIVDGVATHAVLFDHVEDITVCPITGNVAIAENGANQLVVMDDTLGYLTAIPLQNAMTVAFDDLGGLSAISSSLGTVRMYQAGTYGFDYEFDLNGQIIDPQSMVFLSNGDLAIVLQDETLIATQAALPAELEYFKLRKEGEMHQLEWHALTEVNFHGYAIERSLNNRDFEEIGYIDGSGPNSTYQFSTPPKVGDNYYRLRKVDLDGRFDYTEIVSESFEGESEARVYPNPSSGMIMLSQPAKIYDELGRRVGKTSSTTEKVYIQKNGVYWARFENGQVEKIMIIK